MRPLYYKEFTVKEGPDRSVSIFGNRLVFIYDIKVRSMAQQVSVQVEKLSSDGMPSGGILGLQAEKGTVGLFVHSRCNLVASLHTMRTI